MTLIDRVRSFRAEFGVSVAAFCRRTGVSHTTYYTLLHGGKLADSTLERISAYLNKYHF